MSASDCKYVKIDRQSVFNKYGGRCAYTGQPLPDDWQIDHVIPKSSRIWKFNKNARIISGIHYDFPDDIENLNPCLGIVNHYKNNMSIENFRMYMKYLHIRLLAYHKDSKIYKEMVNVAEAFGITPDKPFSGKFYFENECILND